MYSITYIVGLTPKIVFRGGKFMFPKEEAERLAKELREAAPQIEFHINEMPNIK